MFDLVPFENKLALNADAFDSLRKRRFIFGPSFELYQGVRGLYDYGPVGCAVKGNLIQAWRQHFIIEDSMLEVDCTCLTPASVLEASGHVAKFYDVMVRDEKTGDCFRADHLLGDFLEAGVESKEVTEPLKADMRDALARLEGFDLKELGEQLRRFGVKSSAGNELSEPFPFNLMFDTQLGPVRREGRGHAFLRPETAQGIFMNFKRLLDFNAGKLPFAAAQVGLAFRNEIAPRNGLMRVCEFQMCEIEHFCHPQRKTHPRFAEVEDVIVRLFSRELQNEAVNPRLAQTTIGEAVRRGLVGSPLLAYYMARTQLFLLSLGAKPCNLRFRQHQAKEMAHYAQDCWDAEMLTSFGWVECVGHADRACHDLTSHSAANPSKEQLVAFEPYPEGPREVQRVQAVPDKGAIGKAFRKDAAAVFAYLAALDEPALHALKADLAGARKHVFSSEGKEYVLTPELVRVDVQMVKVYGESVVPHVVEPSFGVGRIVYSLLEQAYYARAGDEQRAVLALTPLVAPVKVVLLPLMAKKELEEFVRPLETALTQAGVSSRSDVSGVTVGKRYARSDEIGIPFAITIDYTTIEDKTATLRERDSTDQVRIPLAKLPEVLASLSAARITWAKDIISTYKKIEATNDKE